MLRKKSFDIIHFPDDRLSKVPRSAIILNKKEGEMTTGKVVILTRGGMDKDSKDLFMSTVPKSWQPVWVDMNDGPSQR